MKGTCLGEGRWQPQAGVNGYVACIVAGRIEHEALPRDEDQVRAHGGPGDFPDGREVLEIHLKGGLVGGYIHVKGEDIDRVSLPFEPVTSCLDEEAGEGRDGACGRVAA